MTSLRVRLVLALLIVVLLAIGTATAVYLDEVSGRLDQDQASKAASAAAVLDADLVRLADRLERELDKVLDPRGDAAQLAGDGSAARRWVWASDRLEPGRLDVLKVLGPQGVVLTSGHWPASLGALDPDVEMYRAPAPGRAPVLTLEAVPTGTVATLVRWRSGQWGDQEVIAVAGRQVDAGGLAILREMTGADLVALCVSGRECLDSRGPTLADTTSPFDPTAPEWTRRLRLVPATGDFWVGVDRAGLARLQAGLRLRALGIAILGALLAMGVGLALARRIVRPVEALAAAAAALARGDLGAAEAVPSSTISEVEGLVSAFQQMARDMDQSRKELVQAERVAAWREIARGLAHELKNPLTPIQASMDVIRRARRLDREDFDEILEEQATAVVQEVHRLKELADSFANFARLPDPRPEPLDLPAMLDGVLSLYASVDTNIEVTRDHGAGVGPASADRTQIQTALTNLVKNAVDAVNETPEPRRLLVGVSEVEGWLSVAIHDSGPGIAPSVADRLFTPYVTTKGSRGTGLGLALVHRIALEHGGTVEAGASEELGGACFTLRLPRSYLDTVAAPDRSS